jgi:zinc protease
LKYLTRIGVCAAAALLLAGGIAWAQKSKIVPPKEINAPAREKIFNAETFTLDNRLQIVVIPNHRAPVVTHMVWYKVGAADEQPGHSGSAHFLEHLMFKGSTGLAPGEFSKKVRALGGEDNAFTGQDYTAYHQSIAVEYLKDVMTMEAGRMRGLNPPAEEFASENKVILEERRQRTDNNPGARLAEQMNALLYINHPYGRPIIGWANEMAALTWPDTKAFYDRWYAPDNAILVVAGDVTGQQVYDMAKEIYGPIAKSGKIPERARPVSPPLKGKAEVRLTDPNVREPVVQTGFRVPSSRTNKQESLALEVLDEIMGGGPTSRIYKSLVVEQKIATSAGLSYRSESWDDTEVYVYATPAPNQDLAVVKNSLENELRKVVASGVTEKELSDAITRLQTGAIYARDSLSGPAMIFGSALTSGLTIDDVEYWTYDIASVTAADVNNVAQKYLNPDATFEHSPVTGYLLPEQKTEAPQEEPKE